MREIQALNRLHSAHVYTFANMVYAYVNGVDGFDNDDIFADSLGSVVKLAKPHKDTQLHEFIRRVLSFNVNWWFDKLGEAYLNVIREMVIEAGISVPDWLSRNSRLTEHRSNEVSALIDKAVIRMAPSVFFLLFSDRTFLEVFQTRLSARVKELHLAEYPEMLRKDGILRRPATYPSWLKAGIFYRDRGRCQACNKDLSGLMRPVRDLHIDHIVPLARSGSNDPTNFQLLCAGCNLSKGKKARSFPAQYAPYW
jgi:hypothetical protein